jgi:AraC family transcriptional regulator
MNPVEKSLWFVENRLSGEISLQEIARAAGVSSHYLARAFGAATGHSLMRYARGRRLSEAARKLAAGAPDILTVALEAGYGSHEAFSRAFREHFGMPPDTLRATGSLPALKLVEPIRMDKTLLTELEPPRFIISEELLIAGIGARYTFETNEGIPSQWQRFAPHIGHVPGQVGPETYGLSANFKDDGSF